KAKAAKPAPASVKAVAPPRDYKPLDPKRITDLLNRLNAAYPDPKCALTHRNAWELLVATILSAQCTDVRVNMVTPQLFAKYPTPAKLAAAPQAAVEKLIRSTGFFRAKATSLRGMAKALVEEHGGEMPKTLAELVKMPGV